MSWARPDLFALLLLVPVVLVLVVLAERSRRRLLARLAAIETLATLVAPGVSRARVLQAGLAVLAALALALAAAGPRLGFEWQQQKVEGVAIVVVLDVSRSMDAQDASPSRMEVARREVADLVANLRGDLVGLVIFAAGPYVRIPLTEDYSTFLWAVQDSSADTIRAQGTDAAGAIDSALKVLEKAEGSGKAIVFVSDGEFHDDAADVDAAAARAAQAGVRIYGLGIGDPVGAPIPLPEGGFKKDSTGNVVLSRLDETALQRLATATGGAYVRSVPSDADVRALYEGEIRGKLESAERGMRRERNWHERFQWPLAVGLFVMVASSFLSIGRLRRGATAAFVLLAIGLAAPGPAYAGAAEDGYKALAAQQWDEAARLLGQARVESPRDVAVTQALGEALYRGGRYREAEQLFRTLADQDPSRRATHLYNAGNASYRGGRLQDALSDFQEAAKADPKFQSAQKNAEAVQRELAARAQQPPPKDQQSSQGDSKDEGKDQQGSQADQQQGQEGQPQSGQDGDPSQPQDAQEGQQQPGQSGQQQSGQSGDPNADQQQGEPQTSDPGTQQGGTPPPDDGTREGQPADGTPDATGSGEAEANAEEGDPSQTAVEGDGDGSGGPQAMSAAEAARLVDGVQDGKPRVVVGGRNTEKDW